MSTTRPTKPIPTDADDVARWLHTGLARRIMYGTWKRDLEAAVLAQLGEKRTQGIDHVDMTANIQRTLSSQLTHAYDVAPVVTGDEGTAAIAKAGGIWPLMQRVDRDTKGLREMFLRVDWEDNRVTYRPVFPDCVVAESTVAQPDKPIKLSEARQRDVEGKTEWVWDVLDMTGGGAVYRVESADHKRDLSGLFLTDLDGNKGALTGERYPYRYANGNAFIPYNIRHAEATGQLFDAYAWAEIVEGTLNVGVMRTFLSHVIRDASWPQRWMMDAEFVGLKSKDGLRKGVADPSVVAALKSSKDAQGQPQVGQWAASADPKVLADTIYEYAKDLPAVAGVKAAVSQRAADPRSGFAISINRDDQREAQRKYEPILLGGDQELLSFTAAISNRATGGTLAEDPEAYNVAYRGIPLSVEERKAQLEEIRELRDLGLISQIEAYQMRNPGKTEMQAAAALRQIRQADAA